MRRLRKLLPLLILGLLFGCGNESTRKLGETTQIPAPQPGANPPTLQPVVIRFINESQHVSSEQFTEAVANINWQLMVDLNPRWGTNGQGQIYIGEFDPLVPSVILQDRATGPGGYTDGTHGYVAYRANTSHLWPAYCSHVTLNLLTPGYLCGQSVEAYDYQRTPVPYAESAPWQLADFDFPSRHGFSGAWHDWRGEPAHDLLHKLPYP